MLSLSAIQKASQWSRKKEGVPGLQLWRTHSETVCVFLRPLGQVSSQAERWAKCEGGHQWWLRDSGLGDQELDKRFHDLICSYPRSNVAGKSFKLVFLIGLSKVSRIFFGKEIYITLSAQVKVNYLN